MGQNKIDENNLLISEVNYIYNSLYGGKSIEKLPKIVVNQYICANRKLLLSNDIYGSINIKLIISEKLDIEAIEIVTRGRNGSLLSKKFHILLFLLEVRGDYYCSYTNDKNTFIKAIIIMGFFTIRTLFKYITGLYLISRYNVI